MNEWSLINKIFFFVEETHHLSDDMIISLLFFCYVKHIIGSLIELIIIGELFVSMRSYYCLRLLSKRCYGALDISLFYFYDLIY